MGATGAVMSAVTPVEENNPVPFTEKKIESTLKGFTSFAAFGGIMGVANTVGFLGRAGQRTFFGDVAVNSIAGVGSGVTEVLVQGLSPSDNAINLKDFGISFGSPGALNSKFLPAACASFRDQGNLVTLSIIRPPWFSND